MERRERRGDQDVGKRVGLQEGSRKEGKGVERM